MVELPPPASSAPPSADELSFEQALERLEAVIARLEGGELELESALSIFEEGVRLSQRCAAQVEDAERRIEILTRRGNGWTEQPFASEESSPEEDA